MSPVDNLVAWPVCCFKGIAYSLPLRARLNAMTLEEAVTLATLPAEAAFQMSGDDLPSER